VTDTAFGCWNGREHDTPIVLSFSGNKTSKTSEYFLLPNRCQMIVSGPEDGPALSVDDLKRVLVVLAEAWDVDFGDVLPFGFDPPLAEILPRPLLSTTWIAYFSAELAARFAAPEGVAVERQPNGGCIVQTVDQRFDEANPHHVAMADAQYRAMLTAFGPEPAWGKMSEARARLGWE
jgi:hypothetical protein